MVRPLNPFAPARPIDPAQFVGRHAEISELEAALQHAKCGRQRHFLMTGDRGVGKTSFLDYIRRRAAANDTADGFNFIVVDFAINKSTTRLDLARALKLELDSILAGYAPFREMLDKAWSFIQRIETAGISLRAVDGGSENHRELYIDLADSLCETVAKVCGKMEEGYLPGAGFDGILILIDEVDQASADLDLGSFLKYLLERLNRKGCHRVLLGLAGLPSSIDVLVSSHPSSLRIFDELRLGNLDRDEVDELLAEAELHVVTDGFDAVSFSENAKEQLFNLSNGHPHFVHQFGYCAFEKLCGDEQERGSLIEESHVLKGTFESRGALELIGDVYFREQFNELSENQSALKILDCLSESPRRPMSLDEMIGAGADAKDAAITLRALLDAGLIKNVDDTNQYQLRHPCFGLWLKVRRPQVAV